MADIEITEDWCKQRIYCEREGVFCVDIMTQGGVERIGKYPTMEEAIWNIKSAEYLFNGNKSDEFQSWEDVTEKTFCARKIEEPKKSEEKQFRFIDV